MGQLGDTVNYILFYNPVSTEVGKLLKSTGLLRPKSDHSTPPVVVMQRPLWQLARDAGPWVRVGGLVGCSAVVLGAYGAHRTYPEEQKADLKRIYETANRFHFIHSLALLAVPMCRRPALTGSLLTLGTVLFCGTCYYHAFTGDRKLQKLAPIGGTCLILGWLSMVI